MTKAKTTKKNNTDKVVTKIESYIKRICKTDIISLQLLYAIVKWELIRRGISLEELDDMVMIDDKDEIKNKDN